MRALGDKLANSVKLMRKIMTPVKMDLLE